MRALAASLVLLAQMGCTSLVRQGGDGFYLGGVTPERFTIDSDGCQAQADAYLAYDVRAMGGTRYARNRLFNDRYGSCMRALGYRPRPYAQNLLPQ